MSVDILGTSAEARFNNSLRPRKPEGSLGRTAQDVHLDSHTAPELWTRDLSYTHIIYQSPHKQGRYQNSRPTWSWRTQAGRLDNNMTDCFQREWNCSLLGVTSPSVTLCPRGPFQFRHRYFQFSAISFTGRVAQTGAPGKLFPVRP